MKMTTYSSYNYHSLPFWIIVAIPRLLVALTDNQIDRFSEIVEVLVLIFNNLRPISLIEIECFRVNWIEIANDVVGDYKCISSCWERSKEIKKAGRCAVCADYRGTSIGKGWGQGKKLGEEGGEGEGGVENEKSEFLWRGLRW